MLIIFEGMDGTGKSTQADLLEKHFLSMGKETLRVHPKTTELAGSLRSLVLNRSEPMKSPMEELLFLGSLFDAYVNLVLPTIRRGGVVICDRFFYTTIVRQGYMKGGEEKARDLLRVINTLTTFDMIIDSSVPVFCINMVYPVSEVIRRVTDRHGSLDVYDGRSADFHKANHDGFVTVLASGYPLQAFPLCKKIILDLSPETPATEIHEHIVGILGGDN